MEKTAVGSNTIKNFKTAIGENNSNLKKSTERTEFSSSITKKDSTRRENTTTMSSKQEDQHNDGIIPETEDGVFPDIEDDGQVASLTNSLSSIIVSEPESQNTEKNNRNLNVPDSDKFTQKAILESIHRGRYEINVQNTANPNILEPSSASCSSSSGSLTDDDDCILIQTHQMYTKEVLNSKMPMSHPASFFRPRIEEKCCICHEGPEENNRKKWATNVRCGHVYHSQCIKQAESRKYFHMVKLGEINDLPKCPLCNVEYHPEDIKSDKETHRQIYTSMINQKKHKSPSNLSIAKAGDTSSNTKDESRSSSNKKLSTSPFSKTSDKLSSAARTNNVSSINKGRPASTSDKNKVDSSFTKTSVISTVARAGGKSFINTSATEKSTGIYKDDSSVLERKGTSSIGGGGRITRSIARQNEVKQYWGVKVQKNTSYQST